jgi:hypothetical protein
LIKMNYNNLQISLVALASDLVNFFVDIKSHLKSANKIYSMSLGSIR